MLAVCLTLSVLVSRSVYKPLQDMERVMNEVAKRNFDVHVQVVSNDEIGAVGEGFNRMIMELKQSEFIRETFGKYVSKEIRDEIIKDSTPLEGEMKRVTMLFSDLRGFTSFVESTHPKKVVTTMNQYFSEMSDAIKGHRGLVLQYVGDEIEAVFGAPMTYEDHPDRAVLAAIEMRRRLILLNRSLEKQGFKPFHHGIGVHTGVALAGNIGSKERLSYALVGDVVNLASRIAGLTREFGCDIIVSQTTHDLLTRAFPTERVADVKVRGKKDEVTVYKLLNGP
jgi:adenylate cyclase